MKLTKKSIIGFVTVATLLAGSAPAVFADEVGTAGPKGRLTLLKVKLIQIHQLLSHQKQNHQKKLSQKNQTLLRDY